MSETKPIWPTGQWRLELKKKDAEIERLKDEYESLMGRFRCYVYESKQLITELCDALEDQEMESHPWSHYQRLIQRAREATKSTMAQRSPWLPAELST